MHHRNRKRTIAILSMFGVVNSALALWSHLSASASAYCNFGGSFNCDIVNRGIYAEILGIPVALIGIIGYAALFGIAHLHLKKRDLSAILFWASLGGFGFSLYLTYLEAFVLAAWCVLCLASFAVITVIFVLSATMFWKRPPAREPSVATQGF